MCGSSTTNRIASRMRPVKGRTHNCGVAWNVDSPSGHGRIMSSLNSKALQRSRIPSVPDGKPAITFARLVLVVALFAAAFAVDLLSRRQYSQVLGSAAILGSALTLFPAIRPGLIAASACGLTWVTFNVIRAVADDAGLGVAGRRTVSHVERLAFGGSLPSARLQDQTRRASSSTTSRWRSSTRHSSSFRTESPSSPGGDDVHSSSATSARRPSASRSASLHSSCSRPHRHG